jgi:hypothetical protein
MLSRPPPPTGLNKTIVPRDSSMTFSDLIGQLEHLNIVPRSAARR